MKRPSKEKYYLTIAEAVSKRSTCLKRRYGAVIVNDDEIIATGYNGSVRGEENCCDIYIECPRKDVVSNSGDYLDCRSVHAEQNALLSASRKRILGGNLYLYGEELVEAFGYKKWMIIDNPMPCPICERMLKNAGIKNIITLYSKGE